ncbi:MAG TPA: hypothetical protein VF021_08675 [Longimicrobiales bacterium]
MSGFAQVAEKASDATVRADALHDQAVQMQSDPLMLSEAARLHISEASMRAGFDASAIDCLTLAGNLYVAARRPFDARHAFEQSADRALSVGDLQRAAMLYINASFAAQREGNMDEMARLGRKADLLASSPLLSQAQRAEIHRRITHPQAPARNERERMAVRADSLHALAVQMQQDPARMTDAARLLKEEVKLRQREDPSAVDNLMLAAHLLFVARRPLEARHALEDAGERALAAGDVQRAALAFIEAAFVADKEGNKAETQRLGHRAEMLSISELLTPEQRQEIARRIRRVPFA